MPVTVLLIASVPVSVVVFSTPEKNRYPEAEREPAIIRIRTETITIEIACIIIILKS
jgi:hypothetical protein